MYYSLRDTPAAYQWVARSIARSIARSLGRSIGLSVARSVTRSLGRSVDCSLARSIAQSVARSFGRSIGRSGEEEGGGVEEGGGEAEENEEAPCPPGLAPTPPVSPQQSVFGRFSFTMSRTPETLAIQKKHTETVPNSSYLFVEQCLTLCPALLSRNCA